MPSVQFPLLLIQQDDKDYAQCTEYSDSADTKSMRMFDHKIVITHANLTINFRHARGLIKFRTEEKCKIIEGEYSIFWFSAYFPLISIQEDDKEYGQ